MTEDKKWGDKVGDHRKARRYPNESAELEKENPESVKSIQEASNYVIQLIESLNLLYIPELRFKEFMVEPGWEKNALVEIAEIKRGNGLSKSSIVDNGANSCILYGELFTKYSTVATSIISRTNEKTSVVSKMGDILMPTSDVTPKGLAKASAIYVEDVLLGGDMNIISPNQEKVNSIFLAYSINYFSKKIIDKVSGTTVKHIYVSDLKDISYDFPSLSEQKKIAEFFSALDERIDLQAQKVSLLKEQKKGYQQRVFNRELVFTDDNGNAHPEWEEKKLIEVAAVTSGKRLPKGHEFVEQGVPYISVSDMGEKKVSPLRFSYISNATEKILARYKVQEGDIIISIAGTLGKVNVIDKNLNNANLTENCNRIRVSKEFNSEYIFYILKSSLIQTSITRESTTSGQPKLALERLRNFTVPVPKLNEQKKIAEFFSALDENIELNESKLKLLKEQKKGYLQGIFG